MLTDSPVMLSFPHFYLADPKLREAVEGISPPDPERHELFIDVQPVSMKLYTTFFLIKFFYNQHTFYRIGSGNLIPESS